VLVTCPVGVDRVFVLAEADGGGRTTVTGYQPYLLA